MLRTIIRRYRASFSPGSRIIKAVHADSLTYLEPEALQDLFDAVRKCERNCPGGILIETGCAAGGSAIVMAAAKSQLRPLHVYDVFGMIPPPSAKDGEDVHHRYEVIRNGQARGLGEREYYGYEKDLVQKVKASFETHGFLPQKHSIKLIKGLFQDTLKVSEPVALAHLDGDWYDSVMVCLERIVPKLMVKGRLVIDDYHAWSGCRKAVDDYFLNKRKEFVFEFKSRLHVIRNSI